MVALRLYPVFQRTLFWGAFSLSICFSFDTTISAHSLNGLTVFPFWGFGLPVFFRAGTFLHLRPMFLICERLQRTVSSTRSFPINSAYGGTIHPLPYQSSMRYTVHVFDIGRETGVDFQINMLWGSIHENNCNDRTEPDGWSVCF